MENLNNFWAGFEKQAGKGEALAVLGAGAAGAAGLGALAGHAGHVQKKVDSARHGKDFKPTSFIDRHPKLTGALSLGTTGAISSTMHRRKLDRDNPKVRKVMDEHPLATSGM